MEFTHLDPLAEHVSDLALLVSDSKRFFFQLSQVVLPLTKHDVVAVANVVHLNLFCMCMLSLNLPERLAGLLVNGPMLPGLAEGRQVEQTINTILLFLCLLTI